MKRLIVFLLAFAVWLYPLKTASALLTEPKTEEPIFINYQALRENSKNNSKPLLHKETRVTPTSSPYSGRHYSKDEVIQLIKDYSALYGIQSEAPLCIAKYESGYNQFSKNKGSTASGVFQYLSSTWNQTDEGKAGLSVFDADANVRAAVKYMASRLNARPWVVAPKCPSVIKIN